MMNHTYTRALLLFIFLIKIVTANLKSNSAISFDVNDNDKSEMVLSSVGLGIGGYPSSNLHVMGNWLNNGSLSIGKSNSNSNLNIYGSIGFNVQKIQEDLLLSNSSIVLVDTSNENLSISLPYAVNVTGRSYTIKKISHDNFVWINGGESLIDEESRIHLPSSYLPSLRLMSDGTNWKIMNSYKVEQIVCSENLVAWYKLNESSGNIIVDSSGEENFGRLQGEIDILTNTTTGIFGKAVELDGIDDVIEMEDSDEYSFGDGINDQPFSLSFWVYPQDASASSVGPIAKASDASSGEYYVLIHQNDLYFRLVDDSSSAYIGARTNNTISNDSWYHIVLTYDGSGDRSGLNLYQNSELQVKITDSSGAYSSMENTTVKLKIGLRNNFFKGMIDDFRVYSKELNSDEVSKIYSRSQ